MSDIYNYLRDGGMFIRIKPIITNCETIKTFPTFDVGLKHLLTVVNGSGGGKYTSGELIQVIANAVQGYYFHNWTDPSLVVTDVNAGTTTINMPFADCVITATFLPYRTLTVNNGTGSNNQLKPNDVVQITANAPQIGYVFDNWSGDTAYLSANTSVANITMPDASITLIANYRVNLGNFHFGGFYNHYFTNETLTSSDNWIIPTMAMLATFRNNIGATGNAYKLKEASTDYWIDITSGGGATNELGFNGRAAGYFYYNSGDYPIYRFKDYMSFSCSDYPTTCIRIAYNNADIILGSDSSMYGNQIRLIKTSTNLSHGQTSIYIGNDEKVYPTICIYGQEWLAHDLAETKFRDGSLIPRKDNGNVPYFKDYTTPLYSYPSFNPDYF